MTPNQIKKGREAKGWSRELLAVKLGISLRTMFRWEDGTTAPRGNVQTRLRELLKEREPKKRKAAKKDARQLEIG